MSEQPISLYNLCINVAFAECVTLGRYCKKELRMLPNNVLFDVYYKMYLENQLCLLGVEYSDLEVFIRMLSVEHNLSKLLKIFQSLKDDGSNVMKELCLSYSKHLIQSEPITARIIGVGLKLGRFFHEGSWCDYAIDVLNILEEVYKKREYVVRTSECIVTECAITDIIFSNKN